MSEHVIVTCNKCHGSYDMDFEEGWDDWHSTPGGSCYNEDDWGINVVECHEECRIHGQPNQPGISVAITAIDIEAE